ncbi:MAG: hypothetical protein CR985_02350 [Flavobacteriales bacterium]|nr:MAG: hypothetical protein CR985_02350 [Flavobacteriales bacterium]
MQQYIKNYCIFFLLPVVVLPLSLTSCQKKESAYKPLSKHIALHTNVIPDDDYVGSKTCAECHAKAYKEWQGSDHDKAMEIATQTTVLAPFSGEQFTSNGVTSHFFKKDSSFYVNTEGPDGKYHDYKVIYTFGIKPLQQYLVQFPDGKYQALRTAWDVEKQQFFDLYPDFKIVHSEWLHWSRGGLNWNTMCSDCHSTNVRKNYEENTGTFNTQYSIINVSCEACHGPGKDHVNEAKKLGDDYKNTSSHLFMTSQTDSKTLIDQCARCHMRREQFSKNYNHSGNLPDHYFPQLIEAPLYHADGQILDEVYVYTSFLQSKMYKHGVSCKDCHNSHSTKLKFTGNNLCTRCHTPDVYDVTKHTKHPKHTKDSECINCHMTGNTYMGIDYRRDHSFRIPRPDQSIKYGTPNACTQCHIAWTNEYAWKAYQELYGKPDGIHFSDYLAPAIAGEPNADKNLMLLAQDTVFPDIARASAVSALQQYPLQEKIKDFLAFLDDESPLVKGAALDVLSEIATTDFTPYILTKLKDSTRSVRVKAFYALAPIPKNSIPDDFLPAYQKVSKEFDNYLKTNADFSGGQARKGIFYQKKGDLNQAKSAYEKALAIDNRNNMARTNLAQVYYQLRDYKKAEFVFKQIIEQEPDFGLTYYSLALLYAELNRLDEAIEQLLKARKLMPDNIRVVYNLSLLYDKTDQIKKAEDILENTLIKFPNNPDLLYALAFHYYQQKNKDKATVTIERLINLYPNNSNFVNLHHQIRNL